MQPWEIDPDGPPRALTLAELLIGLQHHGVDWMHATSLQYLRHDGEPDGPPRDGIMLLCTKESSPLPKPLSRAMDLYERELKAIADARRAPCDLPWKVPPAPPQSFEEMEASLRELRVTLWLDELRRETG